jgi:hypothetical protein
MNCDYKRCKYHNLQSINNCSAFSLEEDSNFCISQNYCSAEIGEKFNLLEYYDKLVREDKNEKSESN